MLPSFTLLYFTALLLVLREKVTATLTVKLPGHCGPVFSNLKACLEHTWNKRLNGPNSQPVFT